MKLLEQGYITATDLADYLVKNHSMSFRVLIKKQLLLLIMLKEKRN